MLDLQISNGITYAPKRMSAQDEKEAASKVLLSLDGRAAVSKLKKFASVFDSKNNTHIQALKTLGFGFDSQQTLNQLVNFYTGNAGSNFAMDSLQSPNTAPSTIALIQFLQYWMPGIVAQQTWIRQAKELIGMQIMGAFEDRQIVQTQLEFEGFPQLYGDQTNTPFATFNVNYEYRSTVRFEIGQLVGRLEEATLSRVRIDSAAEKRKTCRLLLDYTLNYIGIYGYNNGIGQTYGILNDPSLNPTITLPATGVGPSTTWASKTFLQQAQDVLLLTSTLMQQSGGIVNIQEMECTLALPTSVYSYILTSTEFGYSLIKFLKEGYPKLRIVQVPEFDGAVGGLNIGYLYADKVGDDNSTDDSKTWAHMVQTQFMTLGVKQELKGVAEAYAMSSAGAMCKRGYAVVKFVGV